MVGPLAEPPYCHLPAKLSFDQSSQAAAVLQIQGPVETQVRAGRHFHDHRMAIAIDRIGHGFFGAENDRQWIALDPIVGLCGIGLPDQEDAIIAGKDVCVFAFPGAGGKEHREIQLWRRCNLKIWAAAVIGNTRDLDLRFDQRHGQQRVG